MTDAEIIAAAADMGLHGVKVVRGQLTTSRWPFTAGQAVVSIVTPSGRTADIIKDRHFAETLKPALAELAT
jgi:hypothetical protein